MKFLNQIDGADKLVEDASNRLVTDAEKNTWNAKASTTPATTSVAGLMSPVDKTKLDGIAAGANNYVHPGSGTNPHGTTKADVGLGSVDNTSDANKPISTATQTALNTKADKTQVLTNVPANAKFTDTVYTHPTSHPASMITESSTKRFVSDSEKLAWNSKPDTDTVTTINGKTGAIVKADLTALGIPAQDTTYSVATTSANGLMSSADKQNLNANTTSRHTHTNKSVIDNFGYLNGELYYGETPLTFLPSEGGGDTLVHRYVHTSNKVIQPTGLDKSTGLFTTIEPINLPAGTKRQVITAFNYQADGIMPREFNGVDGHFIEVVSPNSFYILQGSASGARMTYTNASNTGVDVNAFRFEYDYSNSPIIDLSDLNIKNGRFRIKCTRHRPGWSYVYLGMLHSGGTYRHSYGTFADGRDYLSLDISGLFSIEDNFVSARIENYIKSEWNNSSGTWSYSQGNNGSVLARHFDDPNFDNINISFAIANGSVVEIYDIYPSLNSGSESVDIVDNLTTNDGSKALSAKQGKILNDGKVDNSRVLTDVPLNAKFTDTVYSHPGSHPASMITESSTKRFVSDTEKATWNSKSDTDTVTTINGKTGAISKADIVALGIPSQDTNTTYSEITTAEIDTGTASTLRTITGRRVKYILDKVQGWIGGLTKSDVGLSNVDNTSDLNKPISTATQTALNSKANATDLTTHTGSTSNPHSVTKAQVGLGNVDNVKQMPISGGVLENYREKLTTVSASGGSINLSLGNVFQHTPSGNRTYSITNAVSGQAHSFTLIITMGSTVRTLTFPSSVKWQGGEIPDLTTTNKTYVLTFVTTNGGTTWFGMFGGEF